MIFDSVTYHFRRLDIYFTISAFTYWDSADNPIDDYTMLDELILETGFISGKKYSGRRADILVGFTDQEIPYSYGLCHTELGAILVQEFYTYSTGQHTDNILQHELSHLYETEDHYSVNLDCVMNLYPYRIGFPEYMWIPYGLITNEWCNGCVEQILSKKANWGTRYIVSFGGGGGGGAGCRLI